MNLTRMPAAPDIERRSWHPRPVARLLLAAMAPAFLVSCQHPAPPPPVPESPAAERLGLRGPGLESMRLVDAAARRIGELTVWSAETRPDEWLKVDSYEGLDADAARQLVKDGLMGVEALYAHALSPYPEDLSRELAGHAAFEPRLIQPDPGRDDFPYLLLFANDRFSYGASTPETLRYKSLVGWIHCPETRRLHRLRWFVPLSGSHQDLQRRFRSLRCEAGP